MWDERLPAQGSGARSFFGVGKVQRLAVLAAIDFGVGAGLLLHFMVEKEPALEVAGAELPLLIFIIAGWHARDPGLFFRAASERRGLLGCRCLGFTVDGRG